MIHLITILFMKQIHRTIHLNSISTTSIQKFRFLHSKFFNIFQLSNHHNFTNQSFSFFMSVIHNFDEKLKQVCSDALVHEVNDKLDHVTVPDSFQKRRYSIVFDLDNTLVYTSPIQTQNTSFMIYHQIKNNLRAKSATNLPKFSLTESFNIQQKTFRESMPKCNKRKMFVQIRPYLFEFLRSISLNYNIYFYTSYEREYAIDIVSKILNDAFDVNFSKSSDTYGYFENLDEIIFARECCKFINGYELKDLRILNQPLTDVILIDDIQSCGLLQPKNSLIIPPFYGDTDDAFLMEELLPLLNKCAECQELLSSIRKYSIELSPHLFVQDSDEP